MRPLSVAIFLSVFPTAAWTGDAPKSAIPLRYQDLPKAKLAKLVEVLGTPEIDAAHVAIYSKDGKRFVLATGGYNPVDVDNRMEDAFLSVWDPVTGNIVKEHRYTGITAMALSPDGQRVLLAMVEPAKNKEDKKNGDKKNAARFWLSLRDADSGKELKSVHAALPISAVALADDGKHALAGTTQGQLHYWNLDTEKEPVKLAGHPKSTVFTVAFTPDGTKAISSDDAGKIKIWDLKTGKELRGMEHNPGAFALEISKDGSRLATMSFDHSIRIWDLGNDKMIKELKPAQPSNGLGALAFAPDAKRVLAVVNADSGAGEETSLVMWDIDAGKPQWTRKTNFKGLVPIHFERGLLGGGANRFTAWDLKKGTLEKSVGTHKGSLSGLALTKSGLVSVGHDGAMKSWSGKTIVHVERPAGPLNAIAQSADGLWLVTGGADKMVASYKANEQGWEAVHVMKGHGEAVTGVVVTPDGKHAISVSSDRTLRIWSLKDGKETATLTGHSEGVNGVAISPDGKWVASASDDNSIRLWPIKDGKQNGDAKVLDGHKNKVLCLAFSADGKHLLSGSQDFTVKLWDPDEGECVKTLEGHKNWIHAVAFLPGNRAASVSDDLSIRVWDLGKAQELDQIDLSKASDVPRCLAYDAGRNSLLVGTGGWVILRFEFAKEK